jgi:hypothetical protein
MTQMGHPQMAQMGHPQMAQMGHPQMAQMYADGELDLRDRAS